MLFVGKRLPFSNFVKKAGILSIRPSSLAKTFESNRKTDIFVTLKKVHVGNFCV